jgi:predicted Zn-dependent peptidase
VRRLPEPRRFRHGGLVVLHDHVPGPLTARLDQAALNRRAGELGGEHDADTGYEDMALHFEVFNEDLGEALGLLAEQCFDSTVPSDRFAKEKRVVIDEIRGRADDPANYLHERAWAHFFGDGLGHPVCGTIASVRHMTPAAIRRFMHRRFRPGNMVLAIVGGARLPSVRRALARVFPARGPRGGVPAARVRPRGTGVLRLRRGSSSQVHIVRLMTAPLLPRALLAASVAVEVVGADPDARLFQEVRERLGLGYELGLGVEHGRDWAVVVLSASAAREDAERLRDAVDRTFARAADGFTRAELGRARKKIGYRFARLADSRLDRALAHASREAAGHPTLAASQQAMEALGPADVERAWRTLLAAPTLTAVLSG